jgi:putative transposase
MVGIHATASIESFNGRLRNEFLNGQLFATLFEARVLLEDWRIDYNCHRPHSSLEYLTPDEFEALRSDYNPARTLMSVGQ